MTSKTFSLCYSIIHSLKYQMFKIGFYEYRDVLIVTIHVKIAMPDWQKLCLIKYDLDIHVFVSLNCSFSFTVSLQKLLAHFLKFTRNAQNFFLNDYHFWSGFRGTVVNRVLSSLHRVSLEITLTVPLSCKEMVQQLLKFNNLWYCTKLTHECSALRLESIPCLRVYLHRTIVH